MSQYAGTLALLENTVAIIVLIVQHCWRQATVQLQSLEDKQASIERRNVCQKNIYEVQNKKIGHGKKSRKKQGEWITEIQTWLKMNQWLRFCQYKHFRPIIWHIYEKRYCYLYLIWYTVSDKGSGRYMLLREPDLLYFGYLPSANNFGIIIINHTGKNVESLKKCLS